MPFGKIIKKLRLGANMTQEQLAEMLAISPQAISRWENGAAMPDISLLPMLSNIFGVTSDELLEINLERSNEKIEALLVDARQATYNGEFERALELLRGAYRQYPRSYAIMEKLANAIINVNSRKGIKEYDEAIRLCKNILENCTDSMIRYNALELLGTAYGYEGKEDKVLEVAEQMPPFEFCREAFMLYRVTRGEERLKERQEYLSALATQFAESMSLIAFHGNNAGKAVYSDDERIKILKQIVDIIDILYPDGDYEYKAQYAEQACCFLIDIYMKNKDRENALYWIEKACDYIICFDTYDFDETHTSLVFRGYSDGGWIPENGKNHSAEFLDYLSNTNFDDIRNDIRFENVVYCLEKTAKS